MTRLAYASSEVTRSFLSNLLSSNKKVKDMTIGNFLSQWRENDLNLNTHPHYIFNPQFLIYILYTIILVSKESNANEELINSLLSKWIQVIKPPGIEKSELLRKMRNSIGHYRIEISNKDNGLEFTFKDGGFEAKANFNDLKK